MRFLNQVTTEFEYTEDHYCDRCTRVTKHFRLWDREADSTLCICVICMGYWLQRATGWAIVRQRVV